MCRMGEGLVGSAALDVTDVIRAGTKTRLAFPLSNKAGTLNLEVRVPHVIVLECFPFRQMVSVSRAVPCMRYATPDVRQF